MTEQELNNIPPRWISVTQAMQYVPAFGRKKILLRVKKGDFIGRLDDGEWVIDRYSIDRYFQKGKSDFEEQVKKSLAKHTNVI